MTFRRRIQILAFAYIFAILVLLIATHFYIIFKTNTLYTKAIERFEDFFKDQDKYIDTKYTGGSVRYLKSENPEDKPTIFHSKDHLDRWNEKHSDIYAYYKIDSLHDNWRLLVAEKYISGVMVIYEIYPSYVGYRRNRGINNYSWKPPVESCLDNAYEFWTTNTKSNYIAYYQKGNIDKINKFLRDVPNEYYGWNPDTDNIQRAFDYGVIGTMGWMYNDSYKVFLESTQFQSYELEKRVDVVEKDRYRILFTGGLLLSVIFSVFFILFQKKKIRNGKVERNEKQINFNDLNESLYDKLLLSCSPANFMDPYDRKKVEIANLLYGQLIKLNSTDTKALHEIRSKAINQLNLAYFSSEYLDELKRKCNPMKFMNPYDPAKVSLANELYEKLILNEYDIDILEEIEKEIEKKLLQNN